jgi:uncharacterized membrane protein YkoI
MNQRFVFLASLFISVFILVIVVGVASAVSTNPQNVSVTQMAEREAAYNELLTHANQQIQMLNDQVNVLQGGTASPGVGLSNITPQTAIEIALHAAGSTETLQKMPELVSYEGRSVYEVKLEDGPIYIDSQSGAVAYNGVLQRITDKQAGEIAGKFLGGMDPRWAVITEETLNGTPIYKVIFDGYVVLVDVYGNVLKAQVYTNSSARSGNSSSQPSQPGGGGENEAHQVKEND